MGSLQVFAVNIKHYFHISIFLSRNFLFFFVLTGGNQPKHTDFCLASSSCHPKILIKIWLFFDTFYQHSLRANCPFFEKDQSFLFFTYMISAF